VLSGSTLELLGGGTASGTTISVGGTLEIGRIHAKRYGVSSGTTCWWRRRNGERVTVSARPIDRLCT